MKEYNDDNPNRPETEDDGVREETLRRLMVRRMFQHRPSPSGNPSLTEKKDESKNASNSEVMPSSTINQNS